MLLGDWRELLPERGPFDLVFLDAGDAAESAELAISMLADGGILIKDDLTPGRPIEGDPVRQALLNDPRLSPARFRQRRPRRRSSLYAAAHNPGPPRMP
jgi:predicted O-methyltransferase YrrM